MIRRRFISGDWTSKEVQSLQKLGIKVSIGYSNFIIEEGETYNRLERLLKNHRGKLTNIYTSSVFTVKEINDSDYLSIILANKGYPQPQQNIESYREKTFEINCSSCGYKDKQITSFRIKDEPKWKKNEVLFSLYWEYDSVFVKKEFYEKIFRPLNIDHRDVLIHKSGKVAETVVQLIPPISPSSLLMKDSWYSKHAETTNCCNRIRYTSTIGDFLPSFEFNPNISICLTQEIFGSEGNTFRKIIVNKKIFNLLVERETINKLTSAPLSK